MRELTQTNLSPGNCWQTCVASILDLDPYELPPQIEFDIPRRNEAGEIVGYDGPPYQSALNAYLRTHHGLGYLQLHISSSILATALAPIGTRDGLHMITGKTVRTATSGVRHVVVARRGEIVWDPHPSRAGLLDDADGGERQWSFLVPYPESWKRFSNDPCVCPACKEGKS